jgi:glycosyltransferase involved in cell wall biosynthesis
LFPGYRNDLWDSRRTDGIRVVRVWTYIAPNEGFFRRTLDYLSFMLSATIGGTFLPRPDVVIATSPQFFTACAGYMVSRIKRVPFVFELRDLWPESIKVVGAMRNSAMLHFLEWIELRLYRKAAGIVSVTHAFRAHLRQRGIDDAKIEVVTNGIDLSNFVPQLRDPLLARSLGLEGKFVAGYVGTHGLAHGLETILEAARIVKEWPEGEAYRFVLLGDGARKQALIEQAREMRLDNVIFLDTVPKNEVVRYWSLLDVSIIHLRKAELFESVIPSKLFECMALGIPVLHGVPGESAEIVEKEEIGLVFESGNPQQLAMKLRSLKKDAALLNECRRACAVAAKGYDRNVLAEQMAAFVESFVTRGRSLLDTRVR